MISIFRKIYMSCVIREIKDHFRRFTRTQSEEAVDKHEKQPSDGDHHLRR